jgi:hypothetical protein
MELFTAAAHAKELFTAEEWISYPYACTEVCSMIGTLDAALSQSAAKHLDSFHSDIKRRFPNTLVGAVHAEQRVNPGHDGLNDKHVHKLRACLVALTSERRSFGACLVAL